LLAVFRRAQPEHVDADTREKNADLMAAALICHLDQDGDRRVSLEEFSAGITKLAEQRDKRLWAVAASMLVAGMSSGAVLPAMPAIVQQLGLTQAQFGYVVSAFGLSKLLANLPAGVCVDSYGRRTAMTGGLIVAGVSMAGLGLAGSLTDLIAARFATGIGASFLTAGAITSVADMSTPLNRTRMLAPVMTAFSAGTVFGPAIGGMLIGALGIGPTYYLVGGVFAVNAVATRYLMSETMPTTIPASLSGNARQMLVQWRPLLAAPDVRAVLLVNLAYWVTLAGCNMTLLPLMLANQFSLSPAEIGTVFALQAAVSVAAAGPAAAAADRFGPHRLLAPALALCALPMVWLPLAPGIMEAAPPLAVMALGNTALASAPTALVSNLVQPESRAHALALMRTIGDVGWLLGGVSVGGVATLFGSGPAMHGTASFLVLVAGWFALRRPR